MKKNSLFLCILFFLFLEVNGQISTGEIPYSFTYRKSVGKIPTYNCPQFNVDSLLNNKQTTTTKKFRFAHVFDVKIAFFEKARVVKTASDKLLYQFAIQSDSAYSLNLTFGVFYLPEGGKLFIYNEQKTHVLGAYTAQNNKENKSFAIEPIQGDKIIIEYYEPQNVSDKAKLIISRIGHDYKNVFNYLNLKNVNSSGSCNVDINCPEGSDWQMEKRSVAKIMVGNGDICTGALINNTKNDETPYFLTANHCINTDYNAENSVFLFGYEKKRCGEDEILKGKSISGSILRATGPNERLDFSLVELSETPPKDYFVYYSGWSRKTKQPKKTVSIHHPSGDVLKISLDNDPAITGNYGDGYDQNSHWQIQEWEVGTTEGGSSGSPLFNEDHQIIGDLTGGEADCITPINDYYSKLDRAWNDYSNTANSLSSWLDPLNTGEESIYGYDPNYQNIDIDAQVSEIITPTAEYCTSAAKITPEIIIRNRGLQNLQSAIISYQIDDQQEITTTWTGNILTYQTADVLFPDLQLEAGNHQFKAYTHLPNNLIDENTENDTMNLTISVKYGQPVLFELNTDNYGYETSWSFFDHNGTLLYSGDNYGNDEYFVQTFCLDGGNYRLAVYDEFGDGLCCTNGKGSFKLSYANWGTEIVSGSEFADSSSHEISIVPVTIEKYENNHQPENQINVFPNPTKNDLYISDLPPESNISIWSITGNCMLVKNTDKNIEKINVTKLKAGIYILKIKSENILFTKKIVVLKK